MGKPGHSSELKADASRTHIFLALALAVAILPYLTTLSFGFVYDDRLAIQENAHLRVWPGLSRIFLSDVWSLSGLSSYSNYYRPMFLLAYEVVFYTVGATPWAFHLVNVLFHAAATGLVFFLTLHLWKKGSTAMIAAVLFALHPVHVEPVAWIAALSELAYTFFVLCAVYLYTQERLSRWLPVTALVCYGMALFWKESAVAFLPIAILYDILALRQRRWTRWLSILSVTLAYLVLRTVAIGGLAPAVVRPGLSPATQAVTAVSNVGFYVWKLLVPIQLSAFYLPEFTSEITFTVLGVLALVVVVAWKLRGKTAWAACWIAVALFPVLLVSRIAMPLADRDLYLPSVGFVWLVALSVEQLRPTSLRVSFAILAIGYSALTLVRLPVWRDDISLFEAELRSNPENHSVRLLLASEYGRRGKLDKALLQVDAVLERDPRNMQARIDKAGLLVSARDWAGVRAACTKVLEQNPNSARCLLDMGYIDEEQGRLPEAREKFARAFHLDSALLQALHQQGIVEARMGNLSSAAKTLESVVQRNPTAPSLTNLGSVYANQGEMRKAVDAFQAAVQVDPTFEPARRNLASALADSK